MKIYHQCCELLPEVEIPVKRFRVFIKTQKYLSKFCVFYGVFNSYCLTLEAPMGNKEVR